jgi:hypothetical protein
MTDRKLVDALETGLSGSTRAEGEREQQKPESLSKKPVVSRCHSGEVNSPRFVEDATRRGDEETSPPCYKWGKADGWLE